jgi:thioredoxin reductase (NADPH)
MPVARFEAQQLQELVQSPTECGDTILSAMKARLEGGPKHAMELPMARVRVVGTHDLTDCDEIRSFLSERAVKQARRLGAELILTRRVAEIVPLPSGGYRVELNGDEYVKSRAIILTTGIDWRTLNAQGIQHLIGRGVSYGAARADPATMAGKKVFIVGGGNSDGQPAMFYANYARSVTLLIRSSTLGTSMSQYLIEQLGCKSNVKVETCTEIVSVAGKRRLESIRAVRAGGQPTDRPADALDFMIGADAVTRWLPENLQRDENGFVCTGRDVTDFSFLGESRTPFLLESNLPGFFCAGDVRHGSIKRVSSAVGEGSMAISVVRQFLALQREKDVTVALSTRSSLENHNQLTCNAISTY